MTIDLRTRYDDDVPTVDGPAFLDVDLPAAFAEESELLESTRHLDLRPVELLVDGSSWTLWRDEHGTPRIARTGAVTTPSPQETWTLTPDQVADLVTDQVTPVGLLTGGVLELARGRIARVMDWWLVLRCILDRRPVFAPGSVTISADLDRSFSLDDDPAALRDFLLENGFLHLRGVYREQEMAAIAADMDACAPLHTEGDGRSWWATVEDGTRRVVRMQGFDEHSPTAAAILADDRIDRIGAIVGAGHERRTATTNRIEALFKPIGVSEGISDVPWHKDCSLGRHSYECCALTIGISVTGAGPGSGQLRVIPGSHRALVWPSLLDPSTLGLPDVPLPTATGDVTVHLSCTLHRAEPPTERERKVLYTGLRLVPRDRDAAATARRRMVEDAREQAPLTMSQSRTLLTDATLDQPVTERARPTTGNLTASDLLHQGRTSAMDRLGGYAVLRRLRKGIVLAAALATVATGAVAGGPAAADDTGAGAIRASTVSVATPTVSVPAVPGLGIQTLQADLTQMPQYGYTQDEFFVTGTARSYKPVGPIASNGQWSVAAATSAPYTTRMVVRRPTDPAKFNGTVVVEWFNVTASFDTAPDWQFARVELMRQGYIWVGVSAQSIGIYGAALGLKALDPARYGPLSHPGDDYSYDIFSQASKALTAPRGVAPLAGYKPRYLIADGESQSASRLTTYVNAISPRDHAYDAYMIHSRSAGAPAINSTSTTPMPNPSFIRTDIPTPVMVVESETDIPRYFPARQADSDHYRGWEIAGTSHVDEYMLGPAAAGILGCVLPVNSGPHHFIFHTALRDLRTWMRTPWKAPPSSPRIQTDALGVIQRDVFGNSLGGIRTPQLDIPAATLTGSGNSPGFCSLFGTTTTFTPAQLNGIYGSRETYFNFYVNRTTAAINATFMLVDDFWAILGDAAAVEFS